VGGVISKSSRTATPKNVGRSNATTAEQQAVLEAESAHKHKLDRKYSLTPEDAQEQLNLPMLSPSKLFQKWKGIEYPVDVQRKHDGVRGKARWIGDSVVIESRSGKTWDAVPHINRALESILPVGDELDGEIYLHGKSLQWISSRAKKAHEDSHTLQFHAYDYPVANGDDTLPWVERSVALFALINDNYKRVPEIRFVPTYTSHAFAGVKALHDQFVQEGYEGAMIRLHDGTYEYGARSNSLLKYKDFEDAEFEIVGYKEGEGSETGLVIWTCMNDINTETFDVRPKGTFGDRAWLLKNANEFMGQKLTVRFMGRTDAPKRLPKFPVGHVIRVPEDLG
jgi:DNA ligase-1